MYIFKSMYAHKHWFKTRKHRFKARKHWFKKCA